VGTGETLRKIDPQKIVSSPNSSKVEALCHLKGGESKHFFLHKILRIEEHDWNIPGLTAPHAQGFFIVVWFISLF
jgi:predicted DNA-binding transcriptional regulator YafY